jgi:hypothetical protein
MRTLLTFTSFHLQFDRNFHSNPLNLTQSFIKNHLRITSFIKTNSAFKSTLEHFRNHLRKSFQGHLTFCCQTVHKIIKAILRRLLIEQKYFSCSFGRRRQEKLQQHRQQLLTKLEPRVAKVARKVSSSLQIQRRHSRNLRISITIIDFLMTHFPSPPSRWQKVIRRVKHK